MDNSQYSQLPEVFPPLTGSGWHGKALIIKIPYTFNLRQFPENPKKVKLVYQ